MSTAADVRAFAQTRIGFVLDRKYEILQYIGHGGMSIVYLASDRRLNKTWAIKEFRKTGEQMKDDVFRQSLLDEANLMKGLSHPALPRIVDIIEADGTIFIVMDFIDGLNLKKVMKTQGHPMDEQDVIDWGIQLCDVLDYLHTPDPKKGKPSIVYRDMKPENVMLRDDGSVCLIDFGIARKFDERKSGDTTILGTREYAAPEQLDESVQTDWRADIYSLGVTLHYLVTGHNPKKNIFTVQPIRTYNPQLDEGLETIIAKCVRNDRDQRYQSCREIAYDLEHHETLTKAYRERLMRKVKTFTRLCIAAAVFLVAGIAGVSLSFAEKASTFEGYLSAGDNVSLDVAEGDYEATVMQKLGAYENAIQVDPSRPEPYERMLETCVEDGELASQESSEVYRMLDGYGKNCPDYGLLCYRYANTLFSYTENYAQASTWFQNAISAGGLDDEAQANSRTYIAVSDFHRNLDSHDRQGIDDSSVFVEYWNNLVGACEDIQDAPVLPRSKLKLYELIVDACSSQAYTLPFRNGGLGERELVGRIDYVRDRTEELGAQITSQRDIDLRDYILARCGVGELSGSSTAYKVIEDTFKINLGKGADASAIGASGRASSQKAGE